MNIKYVVLAAALAVVPAFSCAQTTIPSTTATSKQTIAQRKGDQQGRIAGGVKSGQLTSGETSHLEHQEAGINHEERGMRAQDNGHLTKQDRGTLRTQQNQESRRVYRDKHNAKKRSY